MLFHFETGSKMGLNSEILHIWKLYRLLNFLPILMCFFQWLAVGRWFSPDSSTNKTDSHNITEILLKVVLNTINPNTTTYVLSVSHHYCWEIKSRSWRGVLDKHCVIQFVSYSRQVGGFIRVLQFPSPIKLTATIQLKYCGKLKLNTINQTDVVLCRYTSTGSIKIRLLPPLKLVAMI